VNANHGLVAKMLEKEVNNLFRGKKGKATIKKKKVKCVWKSISKFFVVKEFSKIIMCTKATFGRSLSFGCEKYFTNVVY
jgi:hypothetical protein